MNKVKFTGAETLSALSRVVLEQAVYTHAKKGERFDEADQARREHHPNGAHRPRAREGEGGPSAIVDQ